MDCEKSKPTKSAKSIQKRLILWICIAFLAVLVGFAVLLFSLREKKEEPDLQKYYFYPISEENIFENQEYLALDRSVCYLEDPSGYGLKEEISADHLEDFDSKVQFLYRFLETVTAGDGFTYQSYFSEDYLKEHSVPDFTQQMIYKAEIRYVSSASENGKQVFTYRLDYMIYKNNGTYRQDVGSDAIRPQYVVLSEQEDGSFEILNLYVRYEKMK